MPSYEIISQSVLNLFWHVFASADLFELFTQWSLLQVILSGLTGNLLKSHAPRICIFPPHNEQLLHVEKMSSWCCTLFKIHKLV